MNRRFFQRVDVRANGELIWATKGRFGRISTHREYITTHNLSVDGARLELKGAHTFPIGSRARLKLGLEFSDVEILECAVSANGTTDLRVTFITPSPRFVAVVEQWIPIATEDRQMFGGSWTGL